MKKKSFLLALLVVAVLVGGSLLAAEELIDLAGTTWVYKMPGTTRTLSFENATECTLREISILTGNKETVTAWTYSVIGKNVAGKFGITVTLTQDTQVEGMKVNFHEPLKLVIAPNGKTLTLETRDEKYLIFKKQ